MLTNLAMMRRSRGKDLDELESAGPSGMSGMSGMSGSSGTPSQDEDGDGLAPLRSDLNGKSVGKRVEFAEEETVCERAFYTTLFLVSALLFIGAVYERSNEPITM